VVVVVVAAAAGQAGGGESKAEIKAIRMGNKLSCSCAPLIRSKTYRYEDSPWQTGARGGMGGSGGRRGDTGHLLRCGSLRERKRCAYHTIQPLNHSVHSTMLLFLFDYHPYILD